MNNRKWIAIGIAVLSLIAFSIWQLQPKGLPDMRMTVVEKYFVNRSSHLERVARHANDLLRHVHDVRPGMSYLDVGCGVGGAARKIAESGTFDVTGIDVDPDQIEVANRGPALPNLRFRVMNATHLQFGDRQFDVVATSKATHHIPNWERAFEEMARVLRVGGYLIYTDFTAPSWLAPAAGRLFPGAGFPSEEALNLLSAKAGLARVYRSRTFAVVDLIWRKGRVLNVIQEDAVRK